MSNTQRLSGSYDDGGSFGVRLRHERPRIVWYAGASHETRFGESGIAGNVAVRRVLTDRWYAFLSGAGSSDVVFLPRYRFDAQAGYKFGRDLEWVVTTSFLASAAHDEHRDRGIGLGLIRYFTNGVVLEAGTSFNRSSPGDVWASRQNAAASLMKPGRVLSVRANYGGEAYQLLAPGAVLVDFNSFEVGARWDEVVFPRWGVSVGADYYDNPSYNRIGTTVSVFYQFGQ